MSPERTVAAYFHPARIQMDRSLASATKAIMEMGERAHVILITGENIFYKDYILHIIIIFVLYQLSGVSAIDPMQNYEVRDLTGYSRKITTGLRRKCFFLTATFMTFSCRFL